MNCHFFIFLYIILIVDQQGFLGLIEKILIKITNIIFLIKDIYDELISAELLKDLNPQESITCQINLCTYQLRYC